MPEIPFFICPYKPEHATNMQKLYKQLCKKLNQKNVKQIVKIKEINGFLVGGASLSAKKFVDIIKKSIN